MSVALRADWDGFAPSKFQTFGGQLFLHKLPTRGICLIGVFLARAGWRIVFDVWER